MSVELAVTQCLLQTLFAIFCFTIFNQCGGNKNGRFGNRRESARTQFKYVKLLNTVVFFIINTGKL